MCVCMKDVMYIFLYSQITKMKHLHFLVKFFSTIIVFFLHIFVIFYIYLYLLYLLHIYIYVCVCVCVCVCNFIDSTHMKL